MVLKVTKRELDASSRKITAFFQPKTKIQKVETVASQLVAVKEFNKEEWVESLSPAQRELLE
jgi:hypothetical protein